MRRRTRTAPGASVWAALVAMLFAGGPAVALELGAFGDVSYVSSDAAGDADNFALGGLDLYTMQKIDDRTQAFFEVVYEHDGEGFVLDVERYWLAREFSPAFRLGAGRFHAPLGYWNRNYHHGILIQDTVSRPAFLDFEDGEDAILPMHVIGLMATGRLDGGFAYEAAIANSTSIDTSVSPATAREILLANTEDLSDDKSLFARLTYEASALPLDLGLFVMRNNVIEAAAAGSYAPAAGEDLVQQDLLGLDLRYRRGPFNLLAEFYRLDSEAQAGVGDGRSHTADAYYVQLGYRFAEPWKVTYRYESLDFDSADEYFNILGIARPETYNVLALRRELDESNALMLEVRTEDPDGGASTTTTTLNWSFLLF